MNSHPLNVESLESYQTDGFLAVREFLGAERLRELINNVDRFVRDIVPMMPVEHAFYEDKSDPGTLKQIQNMGDYDPWFHELFTDRRIRELAEALLGGSVVPKNLHYLNKPSGVGQPTPAHQDGYYFMLDPCEAVTMWLALDRVDEENDCVRYVKGSHKRGMREHARTRTLGFSQGIVNYPVSEDAEFEDAVPANPGDLLVHDAMTIHRADGNMSADRSRRALGFVYFSERARVDAGAHAVYQQKLAQEMKAQGRI